MLYPAIIASARFETDQTGSDQGGTDAELLQALREDYPALVRRISKLVPDFYTVSVEASLDDAPAIAPGEYIQIRKVERQIGPTRALAIDAGGQPEDVWELIPPADPNTSGNPGRICWRQLGADLEILPPSIRTGLFRLEYIPSVELPNSTTDLDLPPGLEGCLVQMLAMRIRRRLDQDESRHQKAYDRIWAETTSGLVPTSAQPRTISDYNHDDAGW